MADSGDSPGVNISLTQIYEGQQALQDAVSDLKATMEKHIALEEQRSQGTEIRLENHGTRLGAHDVDLTNLNSRVMIVETELKALNKRRLSWPAIAGGIAAIVAAIASVASILMLLNSIAAALNAAP